MSATSPLVTCSKKVTQDVDYGQSIRQIISTTYGESPDAYTEEIANLNRCRQDALRGSAGSDATARDLLYKYFGQLELLELRFPDLRVPFPWADAFTSKQISQLSLAYEKASVIFNIAATLSSLAASQNRASPEGLKRSFNFFRQAAGMFTYINENFLHAPSTDLSKEIVKTLVVMMLAQATETFLERMTEERKGAGLKARVCSQAAHLYHSIQDDAKDFVGKGWFSRSWSLLIQTKAAYFESLAQYHRASADIAASKHGDALTRLKVAVDKAKDATRLAAGFASVFAPALVPTLPSDSVTCLTELTKAQHTLATQALQSARKDNDLIYHESPTTEAALPAIEKTSVAEPISIQEVYATPDVQKTVGTDIFIKLVPLAVHESASMYSEEKAKLVRAQAEAVDIADGELVAALEYMGLPGSLARFKTGLNVQQQQSALADPGPQIKGYVRDISAEERAGQTQTMLDQLQALRSRATATIDAIQRDLDADERECESARGQHADFGFDQAPSSSQAEFRGLRAELKERKEAITSASQSDGVVFNVWQSSSEDIDILADASGDRVDELFARELAKSDANKQAHDLIDTDLTNDDEAEQMQAKVSSIEENLDKLQKIKRERVDVLKDLKERTQADDISHILILNRKTANIEPTLFASELEKFRGHQTRIAATVHHQHATLQDVTNDFKTLTEGKRARDIQASFQRVEKRRRELVARFRRASEAYREARSGAAKGLQFYRDMSEHLNSLQSSAQRYVSARRQERNSAVSLAQTNKRIGSSANADPSLSDIDFGKLDISGPGPSSVFNVNTGYQQSKSPPTDGSRNGPPARPPPPGQLPPRPQSYAPPPMQQQQQQQQHPAYPMQSRPTNGYGPAQSASPYQHQQSYSQPQYAMQQPQQQQSASMLPPPPAPIAQSSLPPPSQALSYSTYASSQKAAYAPQPTYTSPPVVSQQPHMPARQSSGPYNPYHASQSPSPYQTMSPPPNQYGQHSQYAPQPTAYQQQPYQQYQQYPSQSMPDRPQSQAYTQHGPVQNPQSSQGYPYQQPPPSQSQQYSYYR